jgi:hypothetical protein
MLLDQKTHTIREAVGVFNRSDDLQGAIDELLSSGFDRAELSLLAGGQAIEEKLGHRVDKFDGLADDPVTPRTAYVSTEAIGDAQGGLIGGLMSIGGMAAGGAVRLTPGYFRAISSTQKSSHPRSTDGLQAVPGRTMTSRCDYGGGQRHAEY